MSQALNSLRLALDRATTPPDVALARMRYAVYLARMGEVERARMEIGQLRSSIQPGLQADSTAMANLAEGVLCFCTGNWDVALDKLSRAIALGSLMRTKQVHNLSNAWYAHILVHINRMDEVRRIAASVFEHALPDEHPTIIRMSLAIAAGLQGAELYDEARPWHEIARRHAVIDLDDLSIDAILSAAPAWRISNLMVAEIDSNVLPEQVTRARMELESSISYYSAKSWPGFQWMLPLHRVQLLVLEGRYEEAVREGEVWLEKFGAQAPERLKWVALADHAYSLARTGKLDEALRFECESLDFAPSSAGDDERALSVFRRAQLAKMRGRDDLHETLMQECLSFLAAHRRDQGNQRRALEGLQPPASWL